MNLGPHAGYIWSCYLIVAAVIAGLIAWVFLDGGRIARELVRLETLGVRRRSGRPVATDREPEPNERTP